MAPNDVSFRISGDSGDAQRSWLELIGVMKQTQVQISRMGDSLERATRKGNKGVEESVSALKRMQQALAALRGGMTVISMLRSAFNLLTSEIDGAKAAGDRLLQPKLDYQQSKVALLKNVSAAEMPAVMAELTAYDGRTDRAAINQAASAMISAGGLGLSKPMMARAAVATAREYEEASPETLKFIGTAAARLRSVDPTLQQTDAGGQPQFARTLEFLVGAQEKAAQFDPEKFAKFTVPAAINLMQNYGYSKEEAFSELAAMGTIGTDVSGRMTGTTSVLAANQLSAVGAKYGIGAMGEGKFDVPMIREWLREGGPEAMEARRYLAGAMGAALDESELSGMSITDAAGRQVGAGKFKTSLTSLATGQGDMYELYTTALEELQPEAIQGELQAKRDFVARDPGLALYRAQGRTLSLRGEMQESGGTPLTQFASLEEQMEAIYDAMGMSDGIKRSMYRRLGGFSDWVSGDEITEEDENRRIYSTIAPYLVEQAGKMNTQLERERLTEEDIMAIPNKTEAQQMDLMRLYQMMQAAAPQRVIISEDDRNPPVAESPSPAAGLDE